jgi:GAF domain-containing protein
VPFSKPPLPRFGVPRGAGVPAQDWRARHRIVTAVLALHLPVLLVMGLRHGLAHALVDVGIVAAMLAVALLPGGEIVLHDDRPLLLATPHGYIERVGAQPSHGERSWALLPLHAAGRVIGVWRLAWPRERVFDEGERTLLATLAGLGGTALERARPYERERGIAETLQRSLLPAELPAPAGVQVAAHYLPASAGAQVGGDWYDVVELPDGRVGSASATSPGTASRRPR